MTTIDVTTARGAQLRLNIRPVLSCKPCGQSTPHEVLPAQAGHDEAMAFCSSCRTGRTVALATAQPLARVDQLLATRPELADFPAAGVALHRGIREGA